MKMDRIKELLGLDRELDHPPEEGEKPLDIVLLNDDQKAEMESAMLALDDEESAAKKAKVEAERAVQSAAEETLKRLQLVQRGRCPSCGAHLQRHLFASICENCGWNDYEVPRHGGIRIFVRNRAEPIVGDRCYPVKQNGLLVVKDDAVAAWVNRDLILWIEYGWTPEEIENRHRQILDKITLLCGWCNKPCDPDRDGFHIAQVAFGSTQERYTFCSDECYEAFRKMYPARVDRDCYERNCADCNLCIKRYDDDGEGIRLLAKDYIRPKKKD